MIYSDNKTPSLAAFKDLMADTDKRLNADAKIREDYYTKRSGKLLESDVFEALCAAAVGTEFEGTIKLISGSSFPDIVASNYYGVEVKSTEKNHWTSTGSSILESTRDLNVERIFLTFGKLGKPVQFLSRPYEECLSGIAVTHYPRYLIDMRLKSGETIFDKLGIEYDVLRKMENPVAPVSKYYKSQLKAGESLWWVADDIDCAVPATVSLWTALSPEQKDGLAAQGYALFPEILGASNNTKYNRYALWLATNKGIVNTSVRDSFSAGGKVKMKLKSGVEIPVPAAFGRIKKYCDLIAETILNESEEMLKEYWQTDKIAANRIGQWCNTVAEQKHNAVEKSQVREILSEIFQPYFV